MLKTDEGLHAIDIHGKEMYNPGKVLQFGFESKTPRSIGEYRYMKSGEQLFRKAVGGTTKETEYRWFKDIPDFVDIAESQIKSGQKSMNLITRYKADVGRRALDMFKKNVDKDMLRSTEDIKIKEPVNLKDFVDISETKGYSNVYKYSYSAFLEKSYTNPYLKPYVAPYKSPYVSPYKAGGYPSKSGIEKYIILSYPSVPKIPKGTPPYTPYTPSKTPPSYVPPPYKPPKYPPYKIPPPSYSPSYKPSKYQYPSTSNNPQTYPLLRKKLEGYYPGGGDRKQYGTKYKFREFKIPELWKI
jgi:hypothetical protein